MSQKKYKIIRGTAIANGDRTDADTLLFRPTNPKAFFGIGFRNVPINNGGEIRLRLDLVDAPELRGPLGPQSTTWAKKALETVCNVLAFDAPEWSAVGAENLNEASMGPCELLVIGQDKFFRAIGLLFPEETFAPTLSEVTDPTTAFSSSVNRELLRTGHAAPALYTSTPETLRAAARAVALGAHATNEGWQGTKSPLAFTIADIENDNADKVILPKIWRRMMHFATTETGPESWTPYIRKHREVVHVEAVGTMTTRSFITREDDEFSIVAPAHACTWFPRPSIDTSQILAFVTQNG